MTTTRLQATLSFLALGLAAGRADAAPAAPYINQWLVSEAGPAATDPPARPVRYFDDRLFSRNYDDYQDLRSYIGWIRKEKTEAIAVTATTGVWSPAACKAELRVGADQTCQAFVNGAPVGKSDKDMPLRDQVKWPIALRQGWNTLALRVANRNDGRLGFYARITAPDGAAVPGLVYAPAGDAGRLLVTTQPLDKGAGNPLPIGWREWPYVAMDPWGMVPRKSFVRGAESRRAHASPFLLSAAGGQPPYRWRITEGALPAGLTLRDDGAVIGTVSADAKIGRHPFTARVTDAAGASADKALWLEVRERPNKWLEEGRLIGLIHRPEHAPDNGLPGDREKQLDTFAGLMERQGYCAGIVIGWNNGDGAYRWPSQVGRASGRPLNPNGPEMDDLITPYKKALTDHGMRFGFYMGQFQKLNDNFGGADGMVRMFEEVDGTFHPSMVYLDWAFSFFTKRGMYNTSLDAAFSALRARNPDLLIQVNGSHTLPLNLNMGDWDSVSAEGWGAWGDKAWANWPYPLNWPKKQTMDSWRVIPDPGFYYTKGIEPDWQEALGIQISLICEGCTADVDHSTSLVRKPAIVADRLKDWTESAVYNTHVKMADWANPKDENGKPLPPLFEAYTQCNPGPLAAAPWGYCTINLKRDTLYLHVMKNPRGKTGMPADKKLTATPVPGQVASVTCMNTGKPVPFTQTGQELVVDAAQVAPDAVDTLFKVMLKQP